MVGAGTAVDHHQRRALADLDVVDHHAVRVNKALLLRVDGGSGLDEGTLG